MTELFITALRNRHIRIATQLLEFDEQPAHQRRLPELARGEDRQDVADLNAGGCRRIASSMALPDSAAGITSRISSSFAPLAP
jgi:hypothetical protein